MTDKDLTPKLGKYEGREILGTRMTIRNTGDGLSDAMTVDPVTLHHGDEVHVIIKGVVSDVHWPMVKDTEGVARLHVVRAVEATIVDESLAKKHLDEQRKRIRQHAESQVGATPALSDEHAEA